MSYEIVKRIRIENGKVFLKSSCNNVSPKTFEWQECSPLTRLLAECGEEALEFEIFKQYENGNFQGLNGNFQGLSGKYERALMVLHHHPDYSRFDWRVNDTKENRKKAEFETLLKLALKTKLPKDKFVLTKMAGEIAQKLFLKKVTRRFAQWGIDLRKAKVFRWKEDGETVKKWFSNSANWRVEKIA